MMKSGSTDGAAAFPLIILAAKASAHQQADAPKSREANNRVNDSTEERALPTEKPCYQVKLENANQAPVNGTDNG